MCFLIAGQSSLGTGAKEAQNSSGIFHKLSSLFFFFFTQKTFWLPNFFCLILLLRCNFFLLYSDHPIRSLLSPEFPFSLFNDRKCLADLGKGCEQGTPSTTGHSLGPVFFPQAARLLLCFLSKSHQPFCKPRLLLRSQPGCGGMSDATRGARGDCRVRLFSY